MDLSHVNFSPVRTFLYLRVSLEMTSIEEAHGKGYEVGVYKLRKICRKV
jgi:hypothetical protein